MGVPKLKLIDREKLHLNLVKLKKGGDRFEIAVDPDLAVAYKEGKNIDVKDILKSEKIFNDVQKGMLASTDELSELFGTEDALEIAKVMLDEGEIQFTAEYRDNVRADKLRAVINKIKQNAIDPRTGHPIPEMRIQNAFEEAKIKIDELKTADQQMNDILKKLKVVLPLKFETKIFSIAVESKYGSQVIGELKKYKIVKQTWGNDGSLYAEVEMPAGMQDDFFDNVNKITHGNNEIKIIGEKNE